MAREMKSDFLQSCRFHVDATGIGQIQWFQPIPGWPQAGFSAATTPEVTEEPAEYKEGTDIYTRKYPGIPSVSDVTLSRGVAMSDSAFWSWLRVVCEGSAEYRASVDIKMYHREGALNREYPISATSIVSKTKIDVNGSHRVFHLYEAFPTRHKFAGDLDGTASEVSIQELDLAYESVEAEDFGV